MVTRQPAVVTAGSSRTRAVRGPEPAAGQRGHLAGDAEDGQAVGPVGGHLDLEDRVVEAQVADQVGAHGRVRAQEEDAARVRRRRPARPPSTASPRTRCRGSWRRRSAGRRAGSPPGARRPPGRPRGRSAPRRPRGSAPPRSTPRRPGASPPAGCGATSSTSATTRPPSSEAPSATGWSRCRPSSAARRRRAGRPPCRRTPGASGTGSSPAPPVRTATGSGGHSRRTGGCRRCRSGAWRRARCPCRTPSR